MTLAKIAAAVGGTVHDADPTLLVTAPVVFDSRKVPAGGMFVALPGERVDGHDYAHAAVAAGAVGVLATRPVGVPAVVVADARTAYGRLARAVAARLPALRIVAVTGSVGKTTAKDLMGQVLSRLGTTIAPPGNRNNELGLPETVLTATADTRFLVLEMGARRAGDLTYLTGLVPPDIGVVLNVGTAHLGEFGSVENIAAAKGELVAALRPDAVAVLNADDPRVSAMAKRTAARTVTFGLHPHADVRAEQVRTDPAGRAAFTLSTRAGAAAVQLRLHGTHQVLNALAAAAVALQITDDLDLIAAALSAAEPVSAGRMRVSDRRDGVTIIDDAYNASPESVAAALDTLRTIATGQRRAVAVLGAMNELGAASSHEHARVGALVADAAVWWLVAVGDGDITALADAAAAQGVHVTRVADPEQAHQALRRGLAPADVVLIKASHSVGLLGLAERLASA